MLTGLDITLVSFKFETPSDFHPPPLKLVLLGDDSDFWGKEVLRMFAKKQGVLQYPAMSPPGSLPPVTAIAYMLFTKVWDPSFSEGSPLFRQHVLDVSIHIIYGDCMLYMYNELIYFCDARLQTRHAIWHEVFSDPKDHLSKLDPVDGTYYRAWNAIVLDHYFQDFLGELFTGAGTVAYTCRTVYEFWCNWCNRSAGTTR